VALHGSTDNGLCWTPVVRALAGDYDVTMPDLRGHGLSERVEPGQPVDLAADAIALIDQLGFGRPGLLGHSLGAAIAASVAARWPDRVGLLMLEDPPWRDTSSREEDQSRLGKRRQHLDDWQHSLSQLQAQPRDAVVAAGRGQHPTWNDAEIQSWADAKLQLDLDVFRTGLLDMPPWQEIVTDIICPALLITGDPERGAIVTPEVSQDVARRMPQAEIVRIPGAGHSIRRDQVDATLHAITGFLHTHRSTLC
jgi:pimeloyl-ACP methyl ester carboxylesterase